MGELQKYPSIVFFFFFCSIFFPSYMMPSSKQWNQLKTANYTFGIHKIFCGLQKCSKER